MTERPFRQYGLYKGDTLLKIGTARELAEYQGISEMTLYHYASPAYRKRVLESKKPKERIIAVRLAILYGLYKGKELLKTGTIKELAEYQGVTEPHIHYMTTEEYRKINGKNVPVEKLITVIQLETNA